MKLKKYKFVVEFTGDIGFDREYRTHIEVALRKGTDVQNIEIKDCKRVVRAELIKAGVRAEHLNFRIKKSDIKEALALIAHGCEYSQIYGQAKLRIDEISSKLLKKFAQP